MARRRNKNRHRSRRMSYAKRNYLERAGWQNRHHIRNKCRGGNMSPQNILMMDERRHSAFHLLFGNMDFLQVIGLLKRCYEMKNHLPHERQKSIADLEFDGIGLS